MQFFKDYLEKRRWIKEYASLFTKEEKIGLLKHNFFCIDEKLDQKEMPWLKDIETKSISKINDEFYMYYHELVPKRPKTLIKSIRSYLKKQKQTKIRFLNRLFTWKNINLDRVDAEDAEFKSQKEVISYIETLWHSEIKKFSKERIDYYIFSWKLYGKDLKHPLMLQKFEEGKQVCFLVSKKL